MSKLEKQLSELGEETIMIGEKIDERNSRRKIKCQSCEKSHPIRTLILIQTHWETEMHGCCGGGNIREGEIQFICPDTKVKNRLLFDNNEIPWEERQEYETNPEAQFKSKYKSLFKEVVENYDERISGPWVNNYDIDENRKKFGLVAKGLTISEEEN